MLFTVLIYVFTCQLMKVSPSFFVSLGKVLHFHNLQKIDVTHQNNSHVDTNVFNSDILVLFLLGTEEVCMYVFFPPPLFLYDHVFYKQN